MPLRLKMQTLPLLSIALVTAVWLPAWIALGGSAEAASARGLVPWSGLAASVVAASLSAEVERATDQARQSGDALREIVDIVEETAGQVRSIATAAEQQSAASTPIRRTVSMVREISGAALDGMARCEQGLDTLIDQVRALANLNSVFTLLGQGTVQELIEKMASSPELTSLDRGRIEAALRSSVAENPYLELAYVTDGRGRQIVNNIAPAGFAAAYEGTGFGKDWSARPWFAGAMKSGDIFISEVYVSTASGQPCITVSRPIAEGGAGRSECSAST
jgi:methyl-accepting chemotaxis protein